MDPRTRFDVDGSVGRDELGEVFRASTRQDGKKAALKIFEPWTLESEAGREAYRNALVALRRIRPARTPPVADLHLGADHGWVLSRWVEGESLAARLERTGPLDVDAALRIISGVLDALEELHSAGQPHGGLSMSKILLVGGDDAGNVVITDPYQFRLYSVSDPIRSTRSNPNRFLGQPQYFSPEQALGKEPELASDLYTVGLILYELLTGKPPFSARKIETTLKKQIYDRHLQLRVARPGLDVPDTLQEALDTALAKEPAGRFASARDFRRALATIRDDVEEAAERLAAPMGLAPVGVLAGEPVPTDDVADPTELLGDAPPAGPPRATTGEVQVVLSQDAPPEPAREESPSIIVAEDIQEPAAPSASTTVLVAPLEEEAPTAPVGDESPSPDPAEPTTAAQEPADDDGDDADEETSDDSADDAKRGRKRGKKGKGRKKEKAAPTRADADDRSSKAPAAEPAKGGATVSDTTPSAPHEEPKRGSAPSAPINLDDDEELGWFAVGEDQEALVERHVGNDDFASSAQRFQRRTQLVLAAVMVVVLVVVVVLIRSGGSDAPPPSRPSETTPSSPRGESAPTRATPSPAEAPGASPGAGANAQPANDDDPFAGQPDPFGDEVEDVPAIADEGDGDAVAPDADALAPERETPPEAEAAAAVAASAGLVEAVDNPAEPPAADEGPVVEARTADAAPSTRAPEPASTPGTGTTHAVAQQPSTEPVVARAERTRTPPAETAPATTAAADEPSTRDQSRALLRQGRQALESGNLSEARRLATEARELDSSSVDAAALLGDVAFEQRNWAEAARHFSTAARGARSNARYAQMAGRAYFRLGNMSAAVEQFEACNARGGDCQRDLEVARARAE